MKKKFLSDALLNILSFAIPLSILQLVGLPILANKLGGQSYGIIITLISVITLSSQPIGNALNQCRLIFDKDYKDNRLEGDFNLIVINGAIGSAVFVVVATFFIDSEVTFYSIGLSVIMAALMLLKDYFVVGYRLNLNYKYILFNNILLSVGYLVGIFIFLQTLNWQYIYITGLLLSLMFIFATTSLGTEKVEKTPLFNQTLKSLGNIYSSLLIKNMTSYADKFIILWVLNPLSVSIYYSATIIGKMIMMVMSPINSVLLSYLVKLNKVSRKTFLVITLGSLFVGALGYTTTIMVSRPFFETLYPAWAEESLDIVYITTGVAVINIISNTVNPFNLRFNESKWQLYTGLLYLFVYLLLALPAIFFGGLVLFCWATLIAALLNLVVQIIVYSRRKPEVQ